MTDDIALSERNEEITLGVASKLLLFVIWWFSGIGVGTVVMSPSIVGAGISPELLLSIILTNFCSMLLIIVSIPGADESFPQTLDPSDPPE